MIKKKEDNNFKKLVDFFSKFSNNIPLVDALLKMPGYVISLKLHLFMGIKWSMQKAVT